MAEGQDDARIAEIRARHVAGGDPGDPHCEWCSGPDYPIWPCDVADLLAVIDAQRAIMDAQASVSEQHRKRVQEVAERSDALAAEAADVARETEALIEEVRSSVEQIAALAAERDALRARAERAEAALLEILRESAWEARLTEWRKHSVTAVGTQPTPQEACREIRAIARAALAAASEGE